jgi:hypothetical protein
VPFSTLDASAIKKGRYFWLLQGRNTTATSHNPLVRIGPRPAVQCGSNAPSYREARRAQCGAYPA